MWRTYGSSDRCDCRGCPLKRRGRRVIVNSTVTESEPHDAPARPRLHRRGRPLQLLDGLRRDALAGCARAVSLREPRSGASLPAGHPGRAAEPARDVVGADVWARGVRILRADPALAAAPLPAVVAPVPF